MEASGDQLLSAKKVLEEAYKRLLPAIAYLYGPTAGFAASVTVFTTWLLAKLGRKPKEFTIAEDDKAVLLLLKRIREEEARIKALEESLRRAEGVEREVIMKTLNAEKEILETLKTELELRQLRLEALRRLEILGSPKLVSEVRRLVRSIEEGRRLTDQQYKVLKELEERWKRRELEIHVMEQLLGGSI